MGWRCEKKRKRRARGFAKVRDEAAAERVRLASSGYTRIDRHPDKSRLLAILENDLGLSPASFLFPSASHRGQKVMQTWLDDETYRACVTLLAVKDRHEPTTTSGMEPLLRDYQRRAVDYAQAEVRLWTEVEARRKERP